MAARRARALVVGALFAAPLLGAAGCHDPVTEIVLVVDTDLAVPGEIDSLQLEIDAPSGISRQTLDLARGDGGASPFPATLGLVPGGAAGYGPFDLSATVLRRQPNGSVVLVARRQVTGVRFVRGATRALILWLPRSCACQGTSCPNALEPACVDLVDPVLTDFNPAHIPHLPPYDGGADAPVLADGGGPETGSDATPETGGDAPTETAPDAVADAPSDRMPEASADVATPDAPPPDGARDAADAAEAPPPKLARGQACGGNDQCQNGLCVDGVCCESACPCGACNVNPGTCLATKAGTDPRGACAPFACNGAGACETSCPEAAFACSARCAPGAHCDGAGKCAPSTSGPGFFCVVDSCMCKMGLMCPAPDGGGAGKCQ